jgi:hypothetical protein
MLRCNRSGIRTRKLREAERREVKHLTITYIVYNSAFGSLIEF